MRVTHVSALHLASAHRRFRRQISKVATDVPAAAISALSYTAILYPSVQLHAGAPSFFFFTLATFVNLMIATMVGCVPVYSRHAFEEAAAACC
jgi:hypothetical protein